MEMDLPAKPAHRRAKSSTSVLKSLMAPKANSNVAPVKGKGKENTTPPASANPESALMNTPIWAQFATANSLESQSRGANSTKVPLNDRSFEQDVTHHSPRELNSTKTRNFGENQRPGLKRGARPKSFVLTKGKSSISVFESLIPGRSSNDVDAPARKSVDVPRNKTGLLTRTTKVPLKEEPAGGAVNPTRAASRDLLTMAKKPGSKVMGLVAAFNSKSTPTTPSTEIDTQAMDAAFEAMLESRNIPDNMRQNLRALKPNVKADLIRSNDIDITGVGSSRSAPGSTNEKPSPYAHRRGASEVIDTQSSPEENKKSAKSRSRSKTFSFARAGSSKKSKTGSFADVNAEGNPIHLPKSDSSTSLAKTSRGARFFEKRQSKPEDFVSYLRGEQKPEKMEVGKIHKLRQLLRNETVSWVENFIKLGGMNEIVDLLHRIMQVEWREEHEDQLLHEALLCLKALCTTGIALQKLCDIATTLFPALLTMLFDPEHKGPSEYTTRGVIMSILLAHLTSAQKDPKLLPIRAKEVLTYLSDPIPPEDKRPLDFILEMRQSRPYKVWHREVSNVTKEVFWIFLHHLNVIPLPEEARRTSTHGSNSATILESEYTAEQYTKKFFPQPRPPVPAAPYVGGVEWDVTNYLAIHLDILNGVIASLPTREERNHLRKELAASGWEKVMGGTLRLCKEKFYDCVHSGLRNWIAAAAADGWDVKTVRMGPKNENVSPKKSPRKKKEEKPPLLEAPKLDLKLDLGDVKDGVVKQHMME